MRTVFPGAHSVNPLSEEAFGVERPGVPGLREKASLFEGRPLGHTACSIRFMLHRHRLLPAFLASCLAGCSAAGTSDVQGGWTAGTEGRLQFAFGLESSQETLPPGSQVDVLISGPGADGPIDVASGNSVVATFDVQRVCTCTSERDGRYTIRSIPPKHTCAASEAKDCENLVSAFTHSVGDTELVVLDPEGIVLDRAPVRVRD
jgi:hypothetical protein